MGLDAASYPELWRIHQETGVLPEHILPTLYFESGFDPSLPNRAGAPNYGINQASETLISQYAGTDPASYLTWPASRQIATVVRGYVKGLINTYGKIRSATRFEQANFLPGSLKTATDLGDMIVSANDPQPYRSYYEGNKTAFDKANKGYITVADVAAVMARVAESKAVQQAIANTYASRGRYAPLDVGVTGPPIDIGIGLGSPEDINHIVYGDDYSFWDRLWSGYPNLKRVAIASGVIIGGVFVARRMRWI